MEILFNIIWFFRYIIAFIVTTGLAFICSCGWFYARERARGKRVKPSGIKKVRKRGFLVKVFVDAPKRIVKDWFEQEPGDFGERGVVIFCGRQGSGKTSAMVQYTLELKERYPSAKVIGNLGFKGQTDELDHWKKLTEYKNGRKGVVVQIDEMQNWFNSKQSKAFPPEMLSVVCQNRKNRRLILGTAQNFYMIAKDIRSQCNEIRQCATFFGCITVVRRMEPLIDNAGEVKAMKSRGFYFFVHDERLRESYDTYRVIESLSKSGFIEKEA
mgnify:CR=1 FL=1